MRQIVIKTCQMWNFVKSLDNFPLLSRFLPWKYFDPVQNKLNLEVFRGNFPANFGLNQNEAYHLNLSLNKSIFFDVTASFWFTNHTKISKNLQKFQNVLTSESNLLSLGRAKNENNNKRQVCRKDDFGKSRNLATSS